MTTIKEFIECGAYPKDDKGRALVPVRGGRVATIAATDKPGDYPLAGWLNGTDEHGLCPTKSWQADGANTGRLRRDASGDLLPPPPRKVKVTAEATMMGMPVIHTWRTSPSDAHVPNGAKLTFIAEYEMEWS